MATIMRKQRRRETRRIKWLADGAPHSAAYNAPHNVAHNTGTHALQL